MSIFLSPLKNGNISLKNRLVFPAVGTATADAQGRVTEKTMNFFRNRTKGFGLVVVEHTGVSLQGKVADTMLSLCDDNVLDSFRALTDMLHENGCKTQVQLDHGGGWSVPELQNTLNPAKNPQGRLISNELTDAQLEQIVSDFASAAERARRAGFDGVQIKACHVYLLSQFFSPLTNHRNYGKYRGDCFEGRIQLTLDVLNAVRSAVGPDYAVSVRFSVQDYCVGGSTLEECTAAAKLLQDGGADLIDLSGGPMYRYFNPNSQEPGWFGNDALVIKQAISIPVVVTGGITQVSCAEDLLKAGKADLVGICRAAMKDENWALKALSEAI